MKSPTIQATQVIVDVSASRLQVCQVRGGDVVGMRQHRLDASGWEDRWPGALEELGEALSSLVRDARCAGARAAIIYSGPGAVTALTSCPRQAGAAGAERATALALGSLADFPVEDHACATTRLLTERVGRGEQGRPQMHMLGTADAEPRLKAVAGLAQSAGLIVEGLIPAEAVAAVDAATLACEPGADDAPRAVLWIGDHASVLATGSSGRIGFVRIIGVGSESLTEALTRPIRTRTSDGAPVTLGRDAARDLIVQMGIPGPDEQIPGRTDMDGSCVLPLLQPVLQRLAIEVKQSLRFGVAEEDRGRVRLRLAGPGAAVPQLDAVLSRQTGFVLHDAGPQPSPETAASAAAALARNWARTPMLLPAELRSQVARRRVRMALAAGVAVAALYGGIEYAGSRAALTKEQARLAELRAAENSAVSSALRERALAARLALTGLESRMQTNLGATPDWSRVLTALAEFTPPEIRLTDVSLKRDADSARCRICGYTRLEEGRDAAQTIKSYVDGLGGHPAVRGVKMGVTQRMQLDGFKGQGFELTLTLVALPASGSAAVAGAADADDREASR